MRLLSSSIIKSDSREGMNKPIQEENIMALSLDSKIKDIMRSPEGKAVMEKWAPGSTKDPRMKLVGGLTYRKLLSYPESAEVAVHADEIDADLRACSK
jgi:hypothetical protein